MTTTRRMVELTVAQALDILHEEGSTIGEQAFRAGIEQGKYPFVDYIAPDGKHLTEPRYIIHKNLLMDWISERLYDEPVDDSIALFMKYYNKLEQEEAS